MIFPTRYPKCPIIKQRVEEDMARGDITISQGVRPCEVFLWRKNPEDPEEEKLIKINGLWHMWRDDGREGIVEMTDGHIVLVDPKHVRFMDSEQLFGEYDWEDRSEADR